MEDNEEGGLMMFLLGLALALAFGLLLSIVLKPWAGRRLDRLRAQRREMRRRRYYARRGSGHDG